jgi:DNA-binding SARP family transcriptional activator
MRTLQIMLLGNVRVTGSGLSSAVRLTPIIQNLLAYLLLYRQRCHPREVLTELFWPEYDPEKARRCLNTALWRLRRLLEPPGGCQETYLITTPAGHVGFNGDSNYWLDVEAFEQPVSRIQTRSVLALETADARAIEHALPLYTGELLEGFYNDWVLHERERLRALHLDYLARLMHYYRDQGDYIQSLDYGRQILAHDPLREEIHREMIRLYLENGQRALAARQYELCAKALSDELGISPTKEMQRLHAGITQAANHRSSTVILDEPATWLPMLQQLHSMLREVEVAREQLQQMIQLAEQQVKTPDKCYR